MIFLDAHVHLYADHDRDVLCDALLAQAERLAPGALPAMIVVRRDGQPRLADSWAGASRWMVCRRPDADCLVLGDGSRELYAFAGRQVAARERIEALGLLGDADVPDGLPLRESLTRLSDAGLLPVLAWGLGKWLFGRAAIVRDLLHETAPGARFVGDSALRPSFWGEPRPMAEARRGGWRVVYGSDPLPRGGEERVAGQYATRIEGALDPDAPTASLRRLLVDPAVTLRATGRRRGPLATLRRLR